MTHVRSKMIAFVLENSLLLLVGTAVAVLWANLDFDSYDAVTRPLHFWVNEIGMVFFFALAAKEVFEATLPGGSLASARQALAPLAAAVGGMVGPALIFVALASVYGSPELVRGWAIPCATDIAFSAMVVRLIFRSTHPAIPFLLLLAIADDALGLVILALFYPSGTTSLAALVILLPGVHGLGALVKTPPRAHLLVVRGRSRHALMGRHSENHVWLHPDGSLAALPLPAASTRRLFVAVTRQAERLEQGITVEQIAGLMSVRAPHIDATIVGEPLWLSDFRINCRIVATVVESKGSHSVYVSQPGAVAALIETAARALQASGVAVK
jgi:Na+/H+ antiporter 1